MVALNVIARALALCSIVSAATVQTVQTVQTQENTGKYYSLKTKVLLGDKTKDGLYVNPYHTGAGTSDAVLTAKPPANFKGFYNATNKVQKFEAFFEDMNPAKQVWNLGLGYQAAYDFWTRVTIDIASSPTYGFSLNSSGLINPSKVHGWMACDWNHREAQLFWCTEMPHITMPSSCALIELHPEYTSYEAQ
ncbi:hypothetical protein B0J14DRAFT_697334 [Halenospora varia]|nr:hypothetical protein B0J14DRAFT_697334 [Halenospora varia]